MAKLRKSLYIYPSAVEARVYAVARVPECSVSRD